MPCVILLPVISVTLPLPVLMLNSSVLFVLRSITPVFLGTLLVIFVLFVLANLMLRPELYLDMTLSGLLRMVLTCWNRKRRNMFEKASRLVKGLCTHIFAGCSVCSGFARHIAKTVVQILKVGDDSEKS